MQINCDIYNKNIATSNTYIIAETQYSNGNKYTNPSISINL